MTIKKIMVSLLLVLCVITLPLEAIIQKKRSTSITIEQWKKTISQATSVYKKTLSNKKVWNKEPHNFSAVNDHTFRPYAQKLLVNPNSTIIFFGDLHGNINSLAKTLNELKDRAIINQKGIIENPDHYLIFLGDYVDRGEAGVEVIQALLTLKIKNPQQVILIRGNHEDKDLNASYGFGNELQQKFAHNAVQAQEYIYNLYEYLPVVLYIGCKDSTNTMHYIQCCHGGLELGFNAYDFLYTDDEILFQSVQHINRIDGVRGLPLGIKSAVLNVIPKQEIANILATKPTTPFTLGFMWHDFICPEQQTLIGFNKGRGWLYGQLITEYWLKHQSSTTCQLHAVFRAHQHNGTMLKLLKEYQGMVSLWDGLVYTFLSAPLVNTDFNYHTFGMLTTTNNYSTWSLESVVVSD